ncbi:MAG: serine/threonine-protein kinase [Myxococcota bacterium]
MAEPRSVHGGDLPFDEQWIRDQARAQLFGAAVPSTIGRFRVARRLGAGGMGTVYAAHDDALDRPVAIKLLHATGDPNANARLDAEARALASLAHPHVVAVHEVGTVRDDRFIVMELVDGSTLRTWQAEAGRPVASILHAYLQAGEGLAAAHRRGLIHRDFTPDNVLIDQDDARARVADFGLATEYDLPDEGPGAEPEASTQPGSSLSRTSRRHRGGTPAYMAPEQHRGLPASAASDQYAFCVSVFEALAGMRPADGGELPGGLPRRLHRALARGLDEDPTRRWPSLEPILDALRPRRRVLPWVALGSIGAAAALSLAIPSTPTCDPPHRSDDAAVLELRASFGAASDAAAGRTVSSALEAARAAHGDAVVRACTLAPKRTSAETEAARACLDEVERAHDALLARLRAPDARSRVSAPLLVEMLLPTARCNDDAALARWHPTPEQAWTDLLEAWIDLAALPVPPSAIEWTDARWKALTDDAAPASIRALALRVRAGRALRDGRAADAIGDLEACAAEAERVDLPALRIDALAALAYAVGQDRKRLNEAKQIASTAIAALDALGGHPVLRARVLHNLASVTARVRPPDYDAALARHDEAIAALEEAVGAKHPLTLRTNLGRHATRSRAGAPDPSLDATVAEVRAQWGDAHPTSAMALRIAGLAQLRRDDPKAAAETLRDAREATETRLGPEHPDLASDLYNEALALRALSRWSEAKVALQRGLHLHERTHGPEHPELIPWLTQLARTELALEDHEAATQTVRRALTLAELDGAAAKDFAKLRVLLAESLLPTDPITARVHATQAQTFLDDHAGFDALRRRARVVLDATSPGRPGSAAQSRSR